MCAARFSGKIVARASSPWNATRARCPCHGGVLLPENLATHRLDPHLAEGNWIGRCRESGTRTSPRRPPHRSPDSDSQAILTPSAAGLAATIDTCAYSVCVTGNISGSASGGGLCVMDSTNSDGIFVASGTNSGFLSRLRAPLKTFQGTSQNGYPCDSSNR